MQSKPKTNSIITSTFNAERNILTFTVLNEGEVELDLNKVSKENLARAVVHGFNQRIPDAAAIGTTDAEGSVIPKAERTRIKKERMNDLCRFYESGTTEWSRKAEGGGGKSLTIEALAWVQGISYEEAEARVDARAEKHYEGKREKCLKKLSGAPAIAKAMAEIRNERAEKASVAVDADAELDALISGEDAE